MRILAYEYITGGGTCASRQPPPRSLWREGCAMVSALVDDLHRAGHEVVAFRDARFGELALPGCQLREIDSPQQEREELIRCAAEADATWLIAPESDHALLHRAGWVEQAGGRLHSPGSAFIALAADKHATALHLAAAGVAVPEGVLLQAGRKPPRAFPFPAVIKPCHGAGCQGVRRISSRSQLARHGPPTQPLRLEQLHRGTAASVAVLCGPRGLLPLPACAQRLAGQKSFRYQGGRLPLPPALARRAQALAVAALQAMPAATGYVGVDLVLGCAARGQQDVVIEVNPRLTTSYVGLRALARPNLAETIVQYAAGGQYELSFGRDTIEFDPDGRVTRLPAVDCDAAAR